MLSSTRQDDLSDCGEIDPALIELFEQITAWLQSGEAVDEIKLISEHPNWSTEIRNLLPTLRGLAGAGAVRKQEFVLSDTDQ